MPLYSQSAGTLVFNAHLSEHTAACTADSLNRVLLLRTIVVLLLLCRLYMNKCVREDRLSRKKTVYSSRSMLRHIVRRSGTAPVDTPGVYSVQGASQYSGFPPYIVHYVAAKPLALGPPPPPTPSPNPPEPKKTHTFSLTSHDHRVHKLNMRVTGLVVLRAVG